MALNQKSTYSIIVYKNIMYEVLKEWIKIFIKETTIANGIHTKEWISIQEDRTSAVKYSDMERNENFPVCFMKPTTYILHN